MDNRADVDPKGSRMSKVYCPEISGMGKNLVSVPKAVGIAVKRIEGPMVTPQRLVNASLTRSSIAF